jgi:hypothetical protein
MRTSSVLYITIIAGLSAACAWLWSSRAHDRAYIADLEAKVTASKTTPNYCSSSSSAGARRL